MSAESEGYARGFQGLPWEPLVRPAPAAEDAAARFLNDLRGGLVPLRGRMSFGSRVFMDVFQGGLTETFPESEGKPFARSVPKIWARWLASHCDARDPLAWSRETGRRVGALLKEEYAEGAAAKLALFLLDKRLHLDGVRDFLNMRGWLLGTIERLRRSPDASSREQAAILRANLSSIVLRAQHNSGPGYAAVVVERLNSMLGGLDAAIANLARIEPEASGYLKNNRATIIARALHSGDLDYHQRAATALPDTLRILENHPEKPANKRTLVYRSLTNGRLTFPK